MSGLRTEGPCDLDPAALAAWLTQRLGPDDGQGRLERIGGGQSNPTYFLDWAGRRLVLRKQPRGEILRGAHAIDREYRVLGALAATDVPVPPLVHFEEDAGPAGTPFYLMERVAGRVFTDATLPDLAPDARRAVYLEMARTLARLHSVDPGAVGLGDFGRPGDYFARQMRRWGSQLDAAQYGPVPELHDLRRRLDGMMPPDDGRVSIAHGDFRLGNLMFHPEEPRVVAVLDWELSTLGHPLADLAFCCMPWHSAPGEYGGILGTGAEDRGVPSEAEFIAEYLRGMPGLAPPAPFHLAFAMFRFAVIFVGIADRAAAGTAASGDAGQMGPLARAFALRALEVLDGRPHAI